MERSASTPDLGHMVEFERISKELAPYLCVLKDLVGELRDVLSPSRGPAPFTGTYKDGNIIYDGIINTFSRRSAILE
jgi:hypothetical protein